MAETLERVTQVAIVANLVTCGIGFLPGCEQAAEMVEHGILGFFAIELALTMRRLGWGFWRNGWHVFDLAVVALSILPVVADGTTVLRAVRLVRPLVKLLHVAHHASQLRVIHWRWRATATEGTAV